MLNPIPEYIWRFVAQSDQSELFALVSVPKAELVREILPFIVPPLSREKREQLVNAETIHEFPIIKNVRIEDAGDQNELRRILQKDTSVRVEPKRCFEPHHAVRFFLDEKTIEFVICYRCNLLWIFEDTVGDRFEEYFIVGESKYALDKLLKDSKPT